MASADLEIKIISRQIQTKADAFWFGFAELFGKALGFSVSIGIVILVLRAIGVLPIEAE